MSAAGYHTIASVTVRMYAQALTSKPRQTRKSFALAGVANYPPIM
jgi:hypothetical protein